MSSRVATVAVFLLSPRLAWHVNENEAPAGEPGVLEE
jgi:hypothetical protein